MKTVDDTELSEWEKFIAAGNEFEPDEESKDMTLEELQEEHFKLFGKYAEPPKESEKKK